MRTLDEVLAIHGPLPLFTPDGKQAYLEPMQIEDIHRLAQFGRSIGDLPVGYGKTAIATCVALMLQPALTIILVPPALIDQWVAWLQSIRNIGPVAAYDGSPKKRKALAIEEYDWLVMSYGTFRNDHARFVKACGDANVCTIVDECFPAGTPVLVPGGQQAIETLVAGQEVLTSAGPRRIVEVFQNLAFQLTTMELSDGSVVTCTPDHPVFTDLGWLRAGDCEGRWVLSSAAVSDLPGGVQQEDLCALAGKGATDQHRHHLLKILHDEETAAGESRFVQSSWREDARAAEIGSAGCRDTSGAAQRRAQGGCVENVAVEGAPTSSAQGQRYRHDTVRVSRLAGIADVGVRVECGREPWTETAGVPDELQAGLRPSSAEGGARAGWAKSPGRDQTEAGSQEGGQVGRVRVVRVSAAECSAGTPVFNLHVEGRHDYFAGGILVHNCQNLKNYQSQLFQKVNQLSSGRDLLLMSGTLMSSPADAYSYIKLTNPAAYSSFQMFKNIHVAEEDFWGQPKKWQNLELMQANLNLRRVRRTKEEVHSALPKANFIPIYYDLPKAHKELYTQLMNEQLLILDNGRKIDATTANALYHAAQQIISSWGYYAGDETLVPRVYELIDELCDSIDLGGHDLDGNPSSKLILWTQYKRTSRGLLAHMDAKAKKLGGYATAAFSEVDTRAMVRKFMGDPKALSLVAQPASAGAGLNPQAFCWECGFVETPTRTIHFTQAAGRIDRKGQRFNPNIRIYIAKGTVQERLFQNLLSNDDLVTKASGTAKGIRSLIFPD